MLRKKIKRGITVFIWSCNTSVFLVIGIYLMGLPFVLSSLSLSSKIIVCIIGSVIFGGAMMLVLTLPDQLRVPRRRIP